MLLKPCLRRKQKAIKTRKIEQKVVRIKGDNSWLNTGLVLRQVDWGKIKASGTVCFCNGKSHSAVESDGDHYAVYRDDYMGLGYQYCGDPGEDWNHIALIGKNNNGMFVIGKERTFPGEKGHYMLVLMIVPLQGSTIVRANLVL